MSVFASILFILAIHVEYRLVKYKRNRCANHTYYYYDVPCVYYTIVVTNTNSRYNYGRSGYGSVCEVVVKSSL